MKIVHNLSQCLGFIAALCRSHVPDTAHCLVNKLDIYGSVHQNIIYENDKQDATV
jgi:transposase